MERAAGFLIATPVYWFGPSGLLKNFLDRLTCMENVVELGEERPKLWEKVALLLAVQEEEGASLTLASLMLTLNHMGMIVIPYAFYMPSNEWKGKAFKRDVEMSCKLMLKLMKSLSC